MPFENTILIVEDEKELLMTLAEQLSLEDYEVATAADGEQALELLQKKKFSLIVLDLKLPKVSGFDVLKFLKQKSTQTKVIVLTAYADLKNVTMVKDLGADDVIEKPYELGDLIDAIHFVMKK
ncbi:MAG TPA: response regulator [Bacteroidota bacterium]|nr:response regulator [Bacteroidota bacterium]